MKTSRRIFLKQGGLALASIGLAPAIGPSFLRNVAFAAEPQRNSKAGGGRKILICIFQRGGVDGMSMVVPHGDPGYYKLRSVGAGGIALGRTGEGKVIDLDGTFGLHPSLAMLKPIYDAGHFAPVHACGSPSLTRSHFDAQDFMESAVPGDKLTRDGWLARTLRCCPEDGKKSVFRSVALTGSLPRALLGDADTLAIPDLQSFGISPAVATDGDMSPEAARQAAELFAADFQTVYDEALGDTLHGTGKDTFEAMKTVRRLTAKPYVPARGAQYPKGGCGMALQQIAQLIKANVGLEVAFAETGGWDTHAGQGGAQGPLARMLTDFGQGLAALYTDLGDRMADVVVLTMSEFGRTARQNGTGGTDHGTATCFFVLGGEVQGGKVLGQWPGLAREQLYEERDLAVTTDFRDVFGEVAQRHMGVRDLAAVFPKYAASPSKFRGALRV